MRLIPLLMLMLLAGCAAKQMPVREQSAPQQPAPTLDSLSPEYLYLAAQDAMQQGQHTLAIQLLEALLERDAQAVEPRMQLAELLLRLGRVRDAERHLLRLRAANHLNERQRRDVRLMYIRALAARGQWDAALNELVLLQQQAPELEDAYALEARVHVARGHLALALQAVDDGLRRIPASVRLRMLKARLLIERKRWRDAAAELDRVRRLAPDNEQVVLLQGRVALARKQPARAERMYRAYIADHPQAEAVVQALARLLLGQGRTGEAIRLYEQLSSARGGDPAVRKTLALLYFQQGNHARAEALLRALRQQLPKDDDVRFYLASVLEARGALADALREYAAVTKDSPHHADAQLRIAIIEMRNGDLRQAEQRVRAVLRTRPALMGAWEVLSGVLLEAKAYQRLVDESKDIASAAGASNVLLYNRAIALEFLHRYGEMEAALRRILRRNPRHAEALNFLGYSLAERGERLDEAKELIQRALKIKPDSPYYLDSLAWVYYRQGRLTRALRLQRKALAGDVQDPVMYEHLGDIYRALGRNADAAAAYRKALGMKHEQAQRVRRKLRAVLGGQS